MKESWKNTDLPSFAHHPIILVQPQTTVWMTKEALCQSNEARYQHIFDKAVDFTGLIHTGTVRCVDADYHSQPTHFEKCGQSLTVGPLPKSFEEKHLRWGWDKPVAALQCANPVCNMTLALSPSVQSELEFSRYLLHLMLKQMVPCLEMCNYINCIPVEDSYSSDEDDVNKIKGLGLISVAYKLLWGIASTTGGRDKREGFTRWFNLGFTLIPGMRTLNGCDGFDKWLKFLVIRKFKQLKEYHDGATPLLIGPKSKTK